MSDLKDKVADYLFSFLDKELSEIAVDIRQSFLDNRSSKEGERSHARTQLVKAGKAAIVNKAAETERIKTAAHYQGDITKAQGGGDSATRHQLKRQAWKREIAAKGPTTHKSGRAPAPMSATHPGRVDTAVSRALRTATSDPAKKRVLGLQGQAPNNTMDPDFSIKATDAGSTKKFVSQEVLADLRKKAQAEKK